LAPTLGRLPFGLEPASVLQPVKRGIKRSLTNLKRFFRNLLDALDNGISVNRTESGHLQDQHVECPLQEFGVAGYFLAMPRHSRYQDKGAMPRMSRYFRRQIFGCH